MHCGLLSFLLIPPLFSLSSLYRLLSVLLSFPFKSPSLLSSLNFFSLSLFLLLSPFPLLHSSSPPLISCPLVHHPPTLHLVLRPCILLLPFRYSCLSTRCFPLPPSISVFSAVRAAGGSLATSIVSVLCVCVCVKMRKICQHPLLSSRGFVKETHTHPTHNDPQPPLLNNSNTHVISACFLLLKMWYLTKAPSRPQLFFVSCYY